RRLGAPAITPGASPTATLHEPFAHTWRAQILTGPPMIAPVRQFTFPMAVAGEEDAMARGALYAMIGPGPGAGGQFLATCALGFHEPSLPSGIWSCPRPADMLAVAGGYGYLVDTESPAGCLHLPQKPITSVLAARDEGLLLLAGFHNIIAVNADGLAWESQRVSWEGVTIGDVVGGALHGTGWDLMRDEEMLFVMDLRTGAHTGGGYRR
ncbi:MAG: hypothetical protein ABI142_03845, partial [Bryocella sp.]